MLSQAHDNADAVGVKQKDAAGVIPKVMNASGSAQRVKFSIIKQHSF